MAESVFATLERELLDSAALALAGPAAANPAIFRYIEGWHNPHRRHSARGQQSP